MKYGVSILCLLLAACGGGGGGSGSGSSSSGGSSSSSSSGGGSSPPPPADTTPPQTKIDAGPATTIYSNSATITFSADESGATFEGRLDGTSFATVTSPVTLGSL